MHIFSLDPRNKPKPGCLSHPELGPGSGCCNSSSVADCKIGNYDYYGDSSCYCDEACYYSDNCCDDILEIGCLRKLLRACILHLFLHPRFIVEVHIFICNILQASYAIHPLTVERWMEKLQLWSPPRKNAVFKAHSNQDLLKYHQHLQKLPLA